MSCEQSCWYTVWNALTAIGTISLAIVAIWGQWIRMRFYGPKLQISFEDPKGDVASMRSTGSLHRFYHLRVKNERRCSPAHNVRVVIKSLARPTADGDMLPTVFPGPIQLAWQYQPEKPQFQTIGADSWCDLGSLIKDHQQFQLSTLLQSTPFDAAVRMNEKIIVGIVALSDECESNELRLQISWNGQWSDDSDEMVRNLVIKELNN